MVITALRSETPSQPTTGVLPLESVRRSDLPVVGGRALRLAVAAQAGLPVPAGAVVTTTLLGSHSCGHLDRMGSVHELDILFSDLGDGGRTPLAVSLSSVSAGGGGADRVPPATGITIRSELVHAVRRFSVTATILGDRVAAIVQRDVRAVQAGTFLVRPNRRAGSFRDASPDVRRQLAQLYGDVAAAFAGVRLVSWSVDAADQLWLIDVGPNQTAPA